MAWVSWLGYLEQVFPPSFEEIIEILLILLIFPPSFEEIIEILLMSVAELVKSCMNQGNN